MEEGGGEAIQVFLRLKPSKRPSPFIKLAAGAKDDDDDAGQEEPRQLPQVGGSQLRLESSISFGARRIILFISPKSISAWPSTCRRRTRPRSAASSTTTRRTTPSPSTAFLRWTRRR
jgi:hypothetical protein